MDSLLQEVLLQGVLLELTVMKRDYYLLSSGELKRKHNTLYLVSKEASKPIPVSDIDSIHAFGEITINSKLLDYLTKNNICLHFYNYYGYYNGSYYPREYLLSGRVLVAQVQHYLDQYKRVELARKFCQGAMFGILKNLEYYSSQGKDVDRYINRIKELEKQLEKVKTVEELMGLEGNIRQEYYSAFNAFLRRGFELGERVKQPPNNKMNCLISFGNSLMYTKVLSEIYRTQLNPTVSFLHEPGERRYSLSLDLSEIFKPLIVDKINFALINNRVIKDKHFLKELNYCYLNEKGRRLYLQEFDSKLTSTLKHRKLKRNVSFKKLIRMECYKLIKHLLGDNEYEPLKAWW